MENVSNSSLLRVVNNTVEEVKEYVYLGSRVTEDGDGANTEDIDNKLTRENQAVAILQNLWK